MSKKKTHEEYVAELKVKNPDIEVIGQYVNSKTSIEHYCTKHDIFWNITPSNALLGKGCEKCKSEKIKQKRSKTHDEYVQELFVLNPYISVIGIYVNSNTPITHYCTRHGMSWEVSPKSVLMYGGCPTCHYEKVGNKLRKTHDEYVRELGVENPNIEVVEEYVTAKTPILHRCKIHNILWLSWPCCILEGHGCPRCNESHGEKKISIWLDSNNIEYIPQKTFDDCRDKKELPFDFYLPDYNTCIEYDGRQHCEPVDFAGKGEEWAKQQFLLIQLHDEIKNQYCQDNDIKLLRIPYFKNIEEELEKFLFT